MKYMFFLVFFIVSYNAASGQVDSCPCRCISNTNCSYPRQTGHLTIVRKDSLKMTVFKTDSSELILHSNTYYNSDINDSVDQLLNANSLVTQLFKNGLLTPDLLIKAFVKIRRHIFEGEDTTGYGRELDSNIQESDKSKDTTRFIRVLNLQRQAIKKKGKFYDNTLLIQISVIFDRCENPEECLTSSIYYQPAISDFDLLLGSDEKLSNKDIVRFLKKAKIKCLYWSGFEI